MSEKKERSKRSKKSHHMKLVSEESQPKESSPGSTRQLKGDKNKPITTSGEIKVQLTEEEEILQEHYKTMNKEKQHKQRALEAEPKKTPLFSTLFIKLGWLFITLILILCIGSLIVFLAGSKEFMNRPNQLEHWHIPNRALSENQHIFTLKQYEIEKQAIIPALIPSGSSTMPVQMLPKADWSFMLLYESTDDNHIFSQEKVAFMAGLQLEIKAFPDMDKFLLMDSDGIDSAYQFVSLTPFLAPFLALAEGVQESIDAMLYAPFTEGSGAEGLNILYDVGCNRENVQSKRARDIVQFGVPPNVNGYVDKFDRMEDQNWDFVEVLMEAYDFMIDELTDGNEASEAAGVKVKIFGKVVFECAQKKLIKSGVLTAGLAIAGFFVYLVLHFQSFALAGFTLVGLILAVPPAFCFHLQVFGVTFFSALNLYTIFSFVAFSGYNYIAMVDLWAESGEFLNLNTERMAYTYKRILRTLVPQSIAFISAYAGLIFSDFIPFQSAGLEGLLLFLFHLIVSLLYFPPLLALYSNIFEKKLLWSEKICCWCKKDETDEERHRRKTGTDSKMGVEDLRTNVKTNCHVLFRDYVMAFNITLKLPILFISGFIIFAGIYFTSELKKITEPDKWYADDHYLYEGKDTVIDDFLHSPDYYNIKVEFIWGTNGIDQGSKWEMHELGDLKTDDDFVFDPVRFLEICDELRVNY